MNEAVVQVDLGAAEHAGAFGLAPERCGADFVEGGHRLVSSPRKRGPIRRALSIVQGLWVPALALCARPGRQKNYAAPRISVPPFGGGIGAPSAAYSLSLLRSVRIEMPRILAAWVRLPRQCLSVSRIRSRSTSATVRPTRLRVTCSAVMAACATAP